MSAETPAPYLSHSALLTCYEKLIDPTLADGWREAIAKEVFDHIDAQGRLLARAGNVLRGRTNGLTGQFIAGDGAQGDAEAKAVLDELRKALHMTRSRSPGETQ